MVSHNEVYKFTSGLLLTSNYIQVHHSEKNKFKVNPQWKVLKLVIKCQKDQYATTKLIARLHFWVGYSCGFNLDSVAIH